MRGTKEKKQKRQRMEEDELVHIKVHDGKGGEVVFDGMISSDVTPQQLGHLGCFRDRLLNLFCNKATGKFVLSFKGMRYVELIASSGKFRSFSGVLYQCDDGVVRSSKTVPSCESVMMTVSKIPHEECEKVFKCETLEELEINECALRQIPNDIGKMKMLKNLELFVLDELNSIPEEVGELASLTELRIESCGIESLPKSIGRLKQLEVLTFKVLLELKNVPETLGELSSLKELWLENCWIESLPKSIGGLTRLETLYLCDSYDLRSIPEEIGCLSNLRKLEIIGCGIVSLPKRIRELKQLKSVHLEFLEELQLDPEIILAFSRLKKLSVLDCDQIFQGNAANAFCQMLKMSVSLRDVRFDWDTAKSEILREALLENGSITDAYCTEDISDFIDIFERNRSNHARAMLSVVSMLAIRRCRRALSGVPREIIDMLAKMLWITRCDVDAWMIEDRSELSDDDDDDDYDDFYDWW